MHELARDDSPMMEKPKKIRQKLEDRRNRLKQDLIDVEAAIAGLDKHPGFEEVHDAITKVRVY